MLLIHEKPESKETYEIYMNREKEWLAFIDEYQENGDENITLDQLIHHLRQLQDYLLSHDHPLLVPQKHLRSSYDDIARVAIFFAESCHNHKYPLDLDYPTKKLASALYQLFRKR